MPPTKHFFAVRRGASTGIFTSWAAASPHVIGVSGSVYKGFATREEAEAWYHDKPSPGHARVTVPTRPHVILKPAAVHTATRAAREPVVVSGTITVFCDGACPNNGTTSARAGVGVYFGPDDARNYSGRLDPREHRQTNQVAELMAAILTVERADRQRPLAIFTDSAYVVQGMNVWRHAWKRKQWAPSAVKVVNLDYFRRLSDLVDARPAATTFTHVKGHSTSAGNNAADRLATAGAQMSFRADSDE